MQHSMIDSAVMLASNANILGNIVVTWPIFELEGDSGF